MRFEWKPYLAGALTLGMVLAPGLPGLPAGPVFSPAVVYAQANKGVEDIDMSGPWRGWAGIQVTGGNGTYSGSYNDTYGGKPGWMQFQRVGPRTYHGRWGEPGRTGTMVIKVNEDGSQASVDWKADPGSKVGPINGGTDTWGRDVPVAQDFELYALEFVDKNQNSAEVTRLKDSIKAIEDQLNELTHQITPLRNERKALQAQMQQLTAERDALGQKLMQKNAELAHFLHPYQGTADQLKQDIAALEAEVAALAAKEAELTQKLAEPEKKLGALQKRKAELAGLKENPQYKYKPSALAALNKELQQVDAQISKLETELQALRRPEIQNYLALADKKKALQHMKHQLEGLQKADAKQGAVNTNRQPYTLEALQQALLSLYTKRNQLKVELDALTTKEAALSEQILALSEARSRKIQEAKPLWDKLAHALAPYAQAVEVRLDGKTVYSNTWQAPDLKDIDETMDKLQDEIEKAYKSKTDLFNQFKQENQLAIEAGNKLAGSGGWFGGGAIMKNAYTQAGIDFAMDVFEIVEAGVKSGGSGAIVEGLRKIVINGSNVLFDQAVNTPGVNSGGLDAFINEEYNAQLNDPTSSPQLVRTAISRGVDQITPEFAQKTAEWLKPEYFKANNQSLEKVQDLFRRFRTDANAVSAKYPKMSSALSLAEGVAKDWLKSNMKKAAAEEENQLFRTFALHDLNSRMIFPYYQAANFNYWRAQDAFGYWLNEKVKALQAMHPQDGIALNPAVRFKEGQLVEVLTRLRNPKDQDRAVLGKAAMQPKQAHHFAVNASDALVEPTNRNKKVKLTLFHEPAPVAAPQPKQPKK